MAKKKEKAVQDKVDQAAEAIATLPPERWCHWVLYLAENIGKHREGWTPEKDHDFISRLMHEVGQEVMDSFKRMEEAA